LILMDNAMPEMNGQETMRRMRQLPALKDVPIIAISASVAGGDEASSLTAGANAFEPKPIDLRRLLTQIAALLKVTWIYELQPRRPVADPETVGLLLAPPAEEMEALHHLARRGNMQEIMQWASHLIKRDERYRPFANQLCSLANQYRSKAIVSLVERYLDKETDSGTRRTSGVCPPFSEG